MAASLEARIRHLEDIEELRSLTFQYGNTIDRGISGKRPDIDKLDAVFTADALWHYDGASVKGLAAIKEMLADATSGPGLALHGFVNPRLSVEGDTAKGHWLLMVSVERNGLSQQDIYTEELDYVRDANGWRIKSIRLFRATTISG
jgi:putative polyketide hydroxylase